MFKVKLIISVTVLLLVAGSGVAFAAAGNLPEPVKALVGSSAASSVYGDQGDQDEDDADDQGSGGGVSSIAKDKSATGTRTLPNGKVIENHGQAVSQAAKAQHNDDENGNEPQTDEGNGDQSQTETEQDKDDGGNQIQKHQNKENETS